MLIRSPASSFIQTAFKNGTGLASFIYTTKKWSLDDPTPVHSTDLGGRHDKVMKNMKNMLRFLLLFIQPLTAQCAPDPLGIIAFN